MSACASSAAPKRRAPAWSTASRNNGDTPHLLRNGECPHFLGQDLLCGPVILPRVLALLGDARWHVVEVEVCAADVFVNLVPRDWGRHAHARSPSRREGGDG